MMQIVFQERIQKQVKKTVPSLFQRRRGNLMRGTISPVMSENKKGELVLRGKLSFSGNSDYFLGIMGIVKVRSSVRTMVIDLPSSETMMSLNKSSAPSAPFLPSARMG